MPFESEAASKIAQRRVRPFRANDSDSILGILQGSGEAAQWPAESYVNLTTSPGGMLLVCEMQFPVRLVGFLAARKAADEAEILNLAVHPHFRRIGIASDLLLRALNEFKHSAVTRVFLELRASNLPARTLYQRFGFLPIGTRTAYYREPSEDAICMQRKLPAVSL
jgi:ribosomal-protein-alanine N-acetyltransferase